MKVNPDTNKVKKIREEVKDNDGYCPCMIEQTQDTKCPCKYMREESKCICGLYIND